MSTSTCDVVSISSTVSMTNVALLWKNLSVYEPRPRRSRQDSSCWPSCLGGGNGAGHEERRRILKGLNGAIMKRSLNAIMGPSGAGKTTLLKCLFGTSSIKYSGQLFVGEKGTKAVFINQDEEDHLLLNLTVEEAIRFASKVKNSGRGNSCRCVQKCTEISANLVQSLIEQLDLDRCRHTLVGKCSGGQKKRLAIAQELAAHDKPKVIFMDEPTSGIDSSVSYLVLRQLQELSVRNGIAIIATIHQPSYKILELFDQLYILSRRGKAIYQGRPQYLRQHLLRYSLPCPDGHNPADVVSDLASTVTSKESECGPGLDRKGCFSILFQGSKMGHDHSPQSSEIQKIETLEKVAEIECEEIVELHQSSQLFEIRKLCSYQVPRSFCHIWFLFKRCLVNGVLREPKWLIIRFTLHIVVAFILSFLYDDSIGLASSCVDVSVPPIACSCSPKQTLDQLRTHPSSSKNVAFLFFNLLFLMFAAIMPTILTFPTEMKVFLNEHRNGWYNTRSYYWAKTVVELLVQLPLPYFYSAYIYWYTKQPGLERIEQAIPFLEASRFKQFTGVMLLATFIAQGVGFLIGAIFAKNFNISIFVTTIFMLFNFLFAGFFIRISDMGPVEFLTRFSFIRFSFEAMLLSIYGDGRCPSPVSVMAGDLISAGQNLTANLVDPFLEVGLPTTTMMSPTMFPERVTNFVSTVLYQFELDEDQSAVYTRALTWLLIHLFGWRLMTYLCLWWKVNPDSPTRKIFFAYFKLKKCSAKRCITIMFCLMITVVVAGTIIVAVI